VESGYIIEVDSLEVNGKVDFIIRAVGEWANSVLGGDANSNHTPIRC
jgi:hypothetical protein